MAADRPQGRSITFEEFAEVSVGAVLRALEARQIGAGGKFPFPITIGIIIGPEGPFTQLPEGFERGGFDVARTTAEG